MAVGTSSGSSLRREMEPEQEVRQRTISTPSRTLVLLRALPATIQVDRTPMPAAIPALHLAADRLQMARNHRPSVIITILVSLMVGLKGTTPIITSSTIHSIRTSSLSNPSNSSINSSMRTVLSLRLHPPLRPQRSLT